MSRKPLKETRTIDYWKCPYCREQNEEPAWKLPHGGSVIRSEEVECSNCRKLVNVAVSPLFIAMPVSKGDDGQ